jgi:hypothetical protein
VFSAEKKPLFIANLEQPIPESPKNEEKRQNFFFKMFFVTKNFYLCRPQKSGVLFYLYKN